MTDPFFRYNRFDPLADPAAVVTEGRARFTLLGERLVRMEFSPAGVFEDRPSQTFWFRKQPAPAFEVRRQAGGLEIETAALLLRYQPDGQDEFTRRSLRVTLKANGVTWHMGDRAPQNLRGTARTLDMVDGHVRLELGLMSRAGWSLVDDSTTLVLDETGWIARRAHPENQDLYLFAYGEDYPGCLRDFCRVSGAMPLIPRWALGNWWSRYWAYTQAELTGLVEEFREHNTPLAVCVIDMDWHITQTGNESPGWTGYTWNRALFPDPAGFLAWLHAQGLKTTLNVHPAAGVWPHEEAYPAMAARMGVDPAGGEPVAFDIPDPAFTAAYFEVLHHPQEAAGVDFWWIDWQQGDRSRLPGLDPLGWLNHLHYYDLGRGEKRPFVFSRWGGLGHQRYPIGFSGDSLCTWRSLAFQPYFTATAANVGYGWWSHDIGGHQRGVNDPELYARWVQLGVFSPILRLHSTCNPYLERRPWGYDAEVEQVASAALRLRHRLIPYIYSMARRAEQDSLPLITPMYYSHPRAEAAYNCPGQYWFGSELIAAPFTAERDADTRLSRQVMWLPEGEWYDFFSGERVNGGDWAAFYGGLEDIPVLAKAGAIVPLDAAPAWGGVRLPTVLEVHLFAGADGVFDLYEDDGETTAYQHGAWVTTRLEQTWAPDRLSFGLAAQGELSLLPALREWRLVIHGVRRPDEATVQVNGAALEGVAARYDEPGEALTLTGMRLASGDRLALELRGAGLRAARDRRAEQVRRLLRAFRLEVDVRWRIDRQLEGVLAGHVPLESFGVDLKPAQAAALREVLARGG